MGRGSCWVNHEGSTLSAGTILRCASFSWCLARSLSGLSLSCLRSWARTMTYIVMDFLPPWITVFIFSFMFLEYTLKINYWHPCLCLRDFFWRQPIQDIDKSLTNKKDRENNIALSPLLSKCLWKTFSSHFPHLPLPQMIFQALFNSERSPILLEGTFVHQMPSSVIIVLPNVVFPQDTDLWQAGNWHRTGNFQPLCQFSLSFVYQNWLELLTRVPKGRTKVANNHGSLHSISWSRQSQKHNRALTSRHTH